MDVITGRKDKSGKTYWMKIGSAWPNDRGGYQVVFDALPLPDAEGRCSVLLVEPKPRESSGDDYAKASGKSISSQARSKRGLSDELDDEMSLMMRFPASEG
jgi:hypothetical protein